MNPGTFIVLGCGTSVGVPMLGCDCAVCHSANPKNQRTRAAVLLQLPAGNLLIDAGPELRLQLLREKIPLVHSVLFTHYHADHLFGLDDVRVFPRMLGGALPIYCAEDVEEVIRTVFSYAFHPSAEELPAGVLPKLEFHRIAEETFGILGQHIVPIPLIHGRFDCLGFRFNDVAYCTDVSDIPDRSWPLLEGLDTLLLDCLRPGPSHQSHYGLTEALGVIEKLKPKRTYLTHLSHLFDSGDPPPLPANVELAYDGLRIPLGRTL